jgi:hypothetical protein
LTSTGSETLIAESKKSCNFKLKAGRGGEAMNLELLTGDFCGQLAESLMIHGSMGWEITRCITFKDHPGFS